ncbi:MAG: efflux RND transporter permease subunit [Chitinophagales bacterium]|nr:efflux RND transporter permease subunit [Chitinophagales bacterium]
MLNNIIKYALSNRLFVLAISVLLIIYGLYISKNMEIDVFPDLTAPTVTVLTEAHGLSTEEVEKLVTFQIETAVNGATNVRRVRSSSATGISIVWIEFEWNTDIYKARQVVSEKLNSINEKLPKGINTPVMAPQTSIMGEIMYIGVSSNTLSQMEVRTIADWNIRPRLLSIEGVAQVTTIGGDYKEYQILASPQKMNAYNVSLIELLHACEALNGNATGGFISEYGNEYTIKGIGRANSIKDISEAYIKTINNNPITVGDVAEVKIGAAPKIGDGSLNAKPAVIMSVLKQPATNTIELTNKIDDAIAQLSKSIGKDIEINTEIFRQKNFIDASINNIQKVLFEGAIFVILIITLFLMNWRATLISLVTIPISILVTIITLKYLGYTLNTMSLGGIAIAVGDLVDDAIIDVENVFKRLKQNAKLPLIEQKNKIDVIFDASFEIRHSIINATFIIIIAFFPLFFLSGMEGKLLKPLGIAFIVSLFSSLIISITLTPVLCSFLLTSDKQLSKQEQESWLVRKLKQLYYKTLTKALQWKKAILAFTLLLFIITIFILTNLGRSFLPEFNEGSLVISAVSLPGISLEESNKIGNQIEKKLKEIPEVNVTTRRTGRSELDEHAQGVNASEIDAPFTLSNRSRDEFLEDVRTKLKTVSGVNISIGQPISHRIDHMLSGTRANIAIKIFGNDISKLELLSKQIKKEIESVEGLVDINTEQLIEIPQIQIKPNRTMLNYYGLTINDFNEFIDIAFAGETVSQIYEDNKTFNLVLKYDDLNRGKIENMKQTLVDVKDNQKVPLYYLADVVSTTGPNTINRENVQRKTVVSANVFERDQKSVVNEIQSIIENKIELPEAYHIEYGGQFEAEAQASKILLLTSLLSIFIIFLILYKQLSSFSLAFIILINLPLALIGGVFSILITKGMLSIPAIIGFITLFGVATRNGIILISNYKSLQEQGYSLIDTIMHGSTDRLSPILMTALTAGLALIPLALGSSLPGNEIQSPMAKVILGGLLSSTFLNIYIVPIIYYLKNKNNYNNEKI